MQVYVQSFLCLPNDAEEMSEFRQLGFARCAHILRKVVGRIDLNVRDEILCDVCQWNSIEWTNLKLEQYAHVVEQIGVLQAIIVNFVLDFSTAQTTPVVVVCHHFQDCGRE